jgi:hypothetical protein
VAKASEVNRVKRRQNQAFEWPTKPNIHTPRRGVIGTRIPSDPLVGGQLGTGKVEISLASAAYGFC